MFRSIIPVMFCPVCRVEYRSGFTRCADCDVDLVQELPAEFGGIKTEEAIADAGPAKSLTKSVVTFLLHQFIGMYGIPYTAPIVFSLVSSVCSSSVTPIQEKRSTRQ
jgi:hypothetical protein